MSVEKTYTNDELLRMLKERIAESSSTAIAAELGIKLGSLSQVTTGVRPVSPKIASWLLNSEVEKVFRKIA